MKKSSVGLVACALALAFPGCGSDDSGTTPPAGTGGTGASDAGPDAVAGSAGTAGKGGTAGAGTGGTAGSSTGGTAGANTGGTAGAGTGGTAGSGTGGTADAATGGTAGAAGGSAACSTICAAKLAANCPNEPADCAGTCDALENGAPWCASQVAPLLQCTSTQPASSWECKNSGAKLKSGICSSENKSALDCMFAGTSSIPDMSAACKAMCTAQAGLPCASATCEADCVAQTKFGADPCAGAQAAYVLCASKQQASAFECNPVDEPQTIEPICSLQTNYIIACGLMNLDSGTP